MNWFKKSKKVTASMARRITGISTPLGGMQWADPGPSEKDIVRAFLVFLEDRRVLYNSMQLEVPQQVERSVHEIREECTRNLQRLGVNAFATIPIRTIREESRRYHDNCNEAFHNMVHDWDPDRHDRNRFGPGFFTALGSYRATVGYQVALLAAHYDIDVEGDLASVIPGVSPEQT